MDLVEIKEGKTNRHPWEYSRADSILKILNAYSPHLQYADVGAGDAYFASRLAERVTTPIYVVDTGYTDTGIQGKMILLNDIRYLPENSLDVVLLMDVFEHIEDEDRFLNDLLKCVKPGGELLITVPAFQFLLSSHDTFMRHYRRYSWRSLKRLLETHGLSIRQMFYFYHCLFLARMAIVVLNKLKMTENVGGAGLWSFPRGHFFTRIVRNILDVDFSVCYHLNKIGINLPGLSICAICRKKS